MENTYELVNINLTFVSTYCLLVRIKLYLNKTKTYYYVKYLWIVIVDNISRI